MRRDSFDEWNRDPWPKLNSWNYVKWTRSTSHYLWREGHWTIVNGTRQKPEKKADDEDWESDNALAIQSILDLCDEIHKQHISHSTSAKECWEILETNYKTSNKHRLSALLEKFYKFEAGDKSINDSVALLNDTQAEIRAISEEQAPTNFHVAVMLLGGLSDEYDEIRSVLSSTINGEDFKFDKMLYELRCEEWKINKRKITCWNCYKLGHYSNECQGPWP